MNRLIGGLLVVSLLSRPTFFKTEKFAYELLAQKTQIVYVCKRKDEDEFVENESISDILDKLAENTRYIGVLLKEKAKILGKIQARMDLFVHSKTKLSEIQMDAFVELNQKQEHLEHQLQRSLKYIDEKKQLQDVKNEMLRTQCDRTFVCGKLKDIIQHQLLAIETIKEMITHAMTAFETMCVA